MKSCTLCVCAKVAEGLSVLSFDLRSIDRTPKPSDAMKDRDAPSHVISYICVILLTLSPIECQANLLLFFRVGGGGFYTL